MPSTDNYCYTISGKYCACVEFQPDKNHRCGFHSSQLLHYTLEPNPDVEDRPNAPREKLSLAFSTADVVILGWQLGPLAQLVHDNELATVCVFPKPEGEVKQSTPYVASITITPIEKA